jgi:hypothetical protein
MTHSGKIIFQEVTKYSIGQSVIVKDHDNYSICKILEIRSDSILVDEKSEEISLNNLFRLVITNGEKFAPLQHSDWEKALEQLNENPDLDNQYYLVERRSRDSQRLIVLAKLK